MSALVACFGCPGRVTLLDGVRAGEKVVVEGALLLDSQAEQLL